MADQLWKESLHLSNEYPEHFGLVNQCLILRDKVLQTLSERQLRQEELSSFQHVLRFNYYKATDSLRSLGLLCDEGCTGDAETIGRKILEIAIYLKWVSMDPERNLDTLYYDERKRRARQIRRHNKVGWPDNAIRAEALEILKKIEDELKQISKMPGQLPELFEMMRLSGIAQKCLSAYDVFCIATHADIGDMARYYDPKNSMFRPRSDTETVPRLLATAMEMYLLITELILNEFHIEALRKLHGELSDRLSQLSIS